MQPPLDDAIFFARVSEHRDHLAGSTKETKPLLPSVLAGVRTMESLLNRRVLAGVARRIVSKAAAFEGRFPSRTDFGSISIGNRLIVDLEPLGRRKNPGKTKVGRLSFKGRYGKQTVKVYSTFSRQQTALRIALQNQKFGECTFPDIVAASDTLIAEAWIDGTTVAALERDERAKADVAVGALLAEMQGRPDLIEMASSFADAFDYFNDYLIPRLEPWTALDDIGRFAASWRDLYAQMARDLPRRLSHPDLSADNVIREHNTGRFFVIDNELLGVGHGWIIDQRNSCIGTQGAVLPSSAAPLAEMAWRLRRLGSALNAANLQQALAFARATPPS